MPILENKQKVELLSDLGVHPSDLIQANCIIWVEGISDRTYIKRWLELLYPELIEGRDFLFVFYSGMGNLKFDAEEINEELVNVLFINNKAVVVMDSDKKAEGDEFYKSKMEIQAKCEEYGGLALVTDGREIENYIPARVVKSVCKELRGCEVEFTQHKYQEFETSLRKALTKVGAKNIPYGSNKKELSKKFAEHFADECKDEDITGELRDWVEKLGEKIKSWTE